MDDDSNPQHPTDPGPTDPGPTDAGPTDAGPTDDPEWVRKDRARSARWAREVERARELEAMCPWEDLGWRARLAELAASPAAAAVRFAADMSVLASLAADVPRVANDHSGAFPWASFLQEVAVARQVTDRAAQREVADAQRLASVLVCTRTLLEQGVLSVDRARVILTETHPYGEVLAGKVDAEVADRAVLLPAWRVLEACRRSVLKHDPEAAVLRAARATANRSVSCTPLRDGQAVVELFGPAVPLQRWHATVDTRARALRRDGDARTLDALRFDLAVGGYPCVSHSPAPAGPYAAAGSAPSEQSGSGQAGSGIGGDSDGPGAEPSAGQPAAAGHPAAAELADARHAAAAGLRTTGIEPAPQDCRRSRPVQARITVPVETLLGLSNEPGYLAGYGFLSAPFSRQLLLDAELRRALVHTGTGRLLDLSPEQHRPPAEPRFLAVSGVTMCLQDLTLSDVGLRTEPRHDPSPALTELVAARDQHDDGPTGRRTPTHNGARADLDHDTQYPDGPTAAWNLTLRARRTHLLKHHGWTPLRTETATWWTSPAGQIVQVPHPDTPPPGIDPADPADRDSPAVPDPDQLAELDHLLIDPYLDTAPWRWEEPPF